jgi:hypothetical protein
MTRQLSVAAMALFTLALASGSVLRAHDGHKHTIMGTVTMAAADHVMLKDTDGKDVTVHVTKNTKVTRDKKAMKAQDIKAGVRVVVMAVEEKEQMNATEIQVGADARPSAR